MKKIQKLAMPFLLALALTIIPTAAISAAELPAPLNGPAARILEDETQAGRSAETADTDNTEKETENKAAEETAAAAQQTDATFNHVWPASPDPSSESVFIMENSTSMPLLEKDPDSKRYPASTTKILTALVAIENSSMDEIVVYSEAAVSLEDAASNIDAEAGEEMSMKDALYGLMLASGNDCANAIAEHIAGSVPAFAEMMNARAAEIGCTGSHFSNPHGLFAEDHYTTARDMALIAQEAFKNTTFVEIMSTEVYYAQPTNKYEGTRKFTHYDLSLDPESEYYDPDVLGGKTGFLDEAGRCLVSYAARDGFTVIAVQFKGGYTKVFEEVRELLNYIFDNFSMTNVAASERRFSGAVEKAKVVLDPSAQILTLNAIPFDQLESTLTFATDLGESRKAELTAAAGGRELYAVIDYAYADHALGSAAVYLDPTLEIASASFPQVFYLNPLVLIVFVLAILVLTLMIYGTKNKKRTARPRPAPQTYTYRKPHRRRPR